MRISMPTSGIDAMLTPRARSLTRYCRDLRHLIYWMENDRSLDAQPGKIRELRQMLVDMESQLTHQTPHRKVQTPVVHFQN